MEFVSLLADRYGYSLLDAAHAPCWASRYTPPSVAARFTGGEVAVDGSMQTGSEGVPMPPTRANGKVCYIEIPAVDARRSADFYAQVFGWRIRQRPDGHIAFDDTTGEVSGTWVVGRPASSAPGFLIYIMVDSVGAAIDAIISQGGEIVAPIGADAPEVTARFRDPGGNVLGLYQEPVRAGK
jgi:uncharacterized protein